MKAFFRTCAAVALVLAGIACVEQGPDIPDEPEEVVDTYQATINISTSNTVTLDADEGSTGIIAFSCDHEWTLEIPEEAQEWLSASKTSGKSTKTTSITFTAKANSGARRTATCQIGRAHV